MAKPLPSLLKMTPYFRPVVWGGRNLESAYGKPLPPDERIGESFEVSAVPKMESSVSSGPLKGVSVQELVKMYGEDFLGKEVHRRYRGEFPLLIKLLDANDDLSIQVHPDDTYAREKQLGSFGKMEAWYVLRSNNGKVASGLREGMDRRTLQNALDAGTIEEVVEFHPVSEGDIVYLKPGSVHALCRGVMVYEVQQSSSITFRLYDYNRPEADGSLRELHIDQSMDVINFGEPAIVPAPAASSVAVSSEHFVLEQFEVATSRHHAAKGSFACITLVSGSVVLKADGEDVSLAPGDTAVVPANRSYEVTPDQPSKYLISSVPT
jgi:mannose-6-phosphate isomerase